MDAWLAASDKALSHAWALKRLAESYTEKEESRLTPESMDKLREMLQTHLNRGALWSSATAEALT